MADKRITPARPDLAAAHLKGKVEAARFVEGEKHSIGLGRMPLFAKSTYPSEQQSELLHGEVFTVYERGAGWAWGQAKSDGYVGYIIGGMLRDLLVPDTRVIALMAPVYGAPDIKAPAHDWLPLNAVIQSDGEGKDFVKIAPHAFVHYRHLAPLSEHAADFVSVAERFLGAPYVWGGKTAGGLDCSGLIQTSLAAAGIAAPRDTDMMEKALGLPVSRDDITRGDLVFWKGHMGVMLDKTRLLHANAFHMEVFVEDLDQAIARIEKSAGPVTSIKRL
jgi:hypothetical protein